MRIKIFSIRSIPSLSCLLIITCLLSCREDGQDEPVPSINGEVRPVGDPLEGVENFTVDQNGGSIASADGSIVLHFPAGAVSSTTTVTIQKLFNTTPNGVGHAYRLSPHADFASPVTIVMKYSLDSISVLNGLGMAYQDEGGVWNAVKVVDHDKEAQTISVQTIHFSDWSLFESVRVSPASSVVAPGHEVELQATAVLKGEELLTPLTKDSTPLGSTPLDPRYIGMWNLDGPGVLVPDGSNARYTAVADYGSSANVYLTLNISGAPATAAKARIIIGGSYITFDGGPYRALTVHGYSTAMYEATSKATSVIFEGKLGDAEYVVTIFYPGSGPGTIAWEDDKNKECFVMSMHTYPGGSVLGTFTNLHSQKPHHEGSITIDSYQPVGKFVTGTFQGSLTYITGPCQTCFEKGSISGTFFAKRYR